MGAILLLCIAAYTAAKLGSAGAFGSSRHLSNAKEHERATPVETAFDNAIFMDGARAVGTRASHHPRACTHGGGKCVMCALTRGTWCEEYLRQKPIPWRPAPRGNVDCPETSWGTCNGVGTCNYDLGICDCPAGWYGASCDEPEPRTCAHRHRRYDEPIDKPVSHIGPDKLDVDMLEEGWTASRCPGYCDDTNGACWCPPASKHGRKPPPPGAPPWVRFAQRGRPIVVGCKPGTLEGNKTILWGAKPLHIDDLLGPKGWCNADAAGELTTNAALYCGGASPGGCQVEGLHGSLCEETSEETCLNQCSGHGECDEGFCRCYKGWYGHDCSRKKAGLELEEGDHETGAKPWLERVVVDPPAALPEPEGGGGGADAQPRQRRRPLIYLYDMPPRFTSRMHQYKQVKFRCGHRQFDSFNGSVVYSDVYSLETYLHETLATSPHRTFDPEEADFFYVPVYYTCYMWPINGWADYPWFGAPSPLHRYSQAAHLWLEAKRWIQKHYPWWDRRQGRDHLWLTNHDEGACYMPTEIYNTSIMLTHWGRMDPNHVSNTAYGPDNYTAGIVWPGVLGSVDVRTLYAGHPCYDPRKDLVVPAFKPPVHYRWSPLMGVPPLERTTLLFFRGDVGVHRAPNYSRGIRQKLHMLAEKHKWHESFNITLGPDDGRSGLSYTEELAQSLFCLVAPGDGWSSRAEDAILHGCLPLLIMDGVHAPLESILDYDSFALRIREDQINEHLPHLLRALPAAAVARMQRRLAQVWARFAYAHGPLLHANMRQVRHDVLQGQMLNRKDIAQQLAKAKEQVARREAAAGAAAGGAGGGAGSHALTAAIELVAGNSPLQPVSRFPVAGDAFSTLLQWLYSRIPYARGEQGLDGGWTGSGEGRGGSGGSGQGGDGAGTGAGAAGGGLGLDGGGDDPFGDAKKGDYDDDGHDA